MYKKLAILTLLVMIAPIVLAACGPTPEPVTIVETSVVVETVVVEVEGEKVVQEQTVVVETEKVVTATPEPEPTEPPKAAFDGLWYAIRTEPPTLRIVLEPHASAEETTAKVEAFWPGAFQIEYVGHDGLVRVGNRSKFRHVVTG